MYVVYLCFNFFFPNRLKITGAAINTSGEMGKAPPFLSFLVFSRV